MSRILVVYYSVSNGNTREIAHPAEAKWLLTKKKCNIGCNKSRKRLKSNE